MVVVDLQSAYLSACRRIAKELRDNPLRSGFKRDKDYAAVVGNDTRDKQVTTGFLRWLLRTHPAKELAARVAPNDRYGVPMTHLIENRRWSAGSLRYLQVADEIGDAPAVIEIGGGYGGQRLLCASIADYTIVDLPEALDVARAYLALHDMPATFVESGRLDVRPGTFLLSDYALSELEPAEIDNYISEVVSRCELGRITCRDDQREAMVARLEPYFSTVETVAEHPRTSRHDNSVIRFSHPIHCRWSGDCRDGVETIMRELFRSSEPFAFSRWGDGEWSAVLGIGTKNCDGQAYEPLREPLRQILRSRPSYLLGMQSLAMQRFGPQITEWLNANAPALPWLHADVFHDLSKAGELVEFVRPLRERDVVMVGPAHLRGISHVLPYSEFIEIPETNAYQTFGVTATALMASLVTPGRVVALSAGMSANILIHLLAHLGTFIDFGSVWEPYVGRANRSYHAEILAREGGR